MRKSEGTKITIIGKFLFNRNPDYQIKDCVNKYYVFIDDVEIGNTFCNCERNDVGSHTEKYLKMSIKMIIFC
jgi:hypothetical protein